MRHGTAPGNHAVAFGVVAQSLGLSEDNAVQGYLYNVTAGWVAASPPSGPLGTNRRPAPYCTTWHQCLLDVWQHYRDLKPEETWSCYPDSTSAVCSTNGSIHGSFVHDEHSEAEQEKDHARLYHAQAHDHAPVTSWIGTLRDRSRSALEDRSAQAKRLWWTVCAKRCVRRIVWRSSPTTSTPKKTQNFSAVAGSGGRAHRRRRNWRLPHSAIREDASANLQAIRDLLNTLRRLTTGPRRERRGQSGGDL